MITVPMPAWATTSSRPRHRREIGLALELAHPGHVRGLEAAVADLRQHLPPGFAAAQASIARISRSKGNIEPMVTKIR